MISDRSCELMARSIIAKARKIYPELMDESDHLMLIITMENIDDVLKSPQGYSAAYENARDETLEWRYYWTVLLEHVNELQRTKLWKVLE